MTAKDAAAALRVIASCVERQLTTDRTTTLDVLGLDLMPVEVNWLLDAMSTPGLDPIVGDPQGAYDMQLVGRISVMNVRVLLVSRAQAGLIGGLRASINARRVAKVGAP